MPRIYILALSLSAVMLSGCAAVAVPMAGMYGLQKLETWATKRVPEPKPVPQSPVQAGPWVPDASAAARVYEFPDIGGVITLRSFLEVLAIDEKQPLRPGWVLERGYCGIAHLEELATKSAAARKGLRPGRALDDRARCAERNGHVYRSLASTLPANWATLPLAEAYRAVVRAYTGLPTLGERTPTQPSCEYGPGDSLLCPGPRRMLTFKPSTAQSAARYDGVATATYSSPMPGVYGPNWWPVGSAEVIEWKGR